MCVSEGAALEFLSGSKEAPGLFSSFPMHQCVLPLGWLQTHRGAARVCNEHCSQRRNQKADAVWALASALLLSGVFSGSSPELLLDVQQTGRR